VNADPPAAASRWAQAWPDLLAFAGGLAVAWFGGWQTTDLVWSLWLASLVVGYALIVWSVTVPLRALLRGMAADHPPLTGLAPKAATVGLFGVGTLFGLAFFTVHFGGFHYVHSVFLNVFFPLTGAHSVPGWKVYRTVLARYWIFLPMAFLAERAAFRGMDAPPADDLSVGAAAIARRKARNADSGMMVPYKGVMRMHLLIFFFVFAHFAKLENFAVYAVVYAVYFFPWRLLRPAAAAGSGQLSSPE
jgi:hypothetical protein